MILPSTMLLWSLSLARSVSWVRAIVMNPPWASVVVDDLRVLVAEGHVTDVEQPGRDPGGGLGPDLVSPAPGYKVEKLKRLPDSAAGRLLGLVVEGSK